MIAITAIIAISSALFINGQKVKSIDLSNTNTCYALTSAIVNAIKSHDNALIIRNWMQGPTTALGAAVNENDPYCNSVNGRTPVCDSVRLANSEGTAPYLNVADPRTYLNVRGTYTWAQNLYNAERNNGICAMPGRRYTPAELKNILPTPVEMPPWVTSFNLFIKDKDLACRTLSDSMRAQYEVKITATYESRGASGPSTETCSANAAIIFTPDSSRPTLTVRAMSAYGAEILPGHCSDTRTVDQIAGAPGNGWQTVRYEFTSNEPGVLLACRKDGIFEGVDAPDQFRACLETPVGGGAGVVSTTPSDTALTFNAPATGVLQFSNLPDRGPMNGGSLHRYSIRAIDASGNQSEAYAHSFYVHSPTCTTLPQNYCPNAEINPTPSPFPIEEPYNTALLGRTPWISTNIGQRPLDTCMNGPCPLGTHSECDPVMREATCYNQSFADDCGLNKCPGNWTPTCASTNPAFVSCKARVTTACGDDCGTTGTARDCNLAPRPETIDCGVAIRDECDNDCGVGTKDCPPCSDTDDPDLLPPCPVEPTPEPTAFASDEGMWNCQRHGRGDTSTCTLPSPGYIVLPAGYARYRLILQKIEGHRHGGSGMNFRMSISGPSGSGFWSRSGEGWELEREIKDDTHPMMLIDHFGPFPRVIGEVAGGGEVRMSFSSWVLDAHSQLFWRWEAMTP